ncbi:hypothetical protein [Actinoplanes sp. GCM10030250]|uniref:hypothetical protein n=1 Tax=Actinoplanes sp. GCM10030250 TaxID=3273376 RepID=UPI00366B406F
MNSAITAVSLHKPDGMILSTGNIYFTSHDALGAHVFRTAQTSGPGDETELYREPPGNLFGDIVFAKVGGAFFGYFWTLDENAGSSIKRIPLTGAQEAHVVTEPVNDIDIVNSYHNLVADGVNLYWQQSTSVNKIPISNGAVTSLDPCHANTPTAGVHQQGKTIVYASVNDVRFVPITGAVTTPQVRTIATADTTVTAILPVANGTYWGERNGSIKLRTGSVTHTIQGSQSGIPSAMTTNGHTAGGALAWMQSTSSGCEMRLKLHLSDITVPVSDNALGTTMTSSGNVFWGDDSGVHRLAL